MPTLTLIAHYPHDKQESMARYANWLEVGFLDAGWKVHRTTPSPVFGKLKRGATGLGKWFGYIDKYLLFPWTLRKHLRSSCPDVICVPDHSHGMYLKLLKGHTTIVHCHDLFAIRAALGKIYHQPIGWTGKIYQRWISGGLEKAATVCCVSAQSANEFREIFPEFSARIEVTQNGLNYPYSPVCFIEEKTQIDSIRERVGVQDRQFILHVGGNHWYKNRQGLVRAFAKLSASGQTEVDLVLVGEGPSDSLRIAIAESGASNRIRCLSGVSNGDLRLLYGLCDLFCFPSISEGFGWPIAEALACGATVLTTDKDPMREVGGKACQYLPALSETEPVSEDWCNFTANKMSELLTRTDREKEISRSAAITHAEQFTPEKCFQRILDVYESVTEL